MNSAGIKICLNRQAYVSHERPQPNATTPPRHIADGPPSGFLFRWRILLRKCSKEKNNNIRMTLGRRLFLLSAQRRKHACTRKGKDPFPSPLSAKQEKTKRNGSGDVVRKFRKKKWEKGFHPLVQGEKLLRLTRSRFHSLNTFMENLS